ncbi:MAG: hypothetical protein AAFR14_05930 [Bacteroidota bacterium]
MYLIFDVSANGKPKSYKAPLDDAFNWPRLLHVSWIILDKDLKPTADYNVFVKPEHFSVNEEILKRHHMEQEQLSDGVAIKDVLDQFAESVTTCEYVFAHNLQLNESIMGSEYYRASRSNPLIAADKYCLMHEATYFCKLPGKRGYKWPSLQEMHRIMFKQGFTPSGNARADVIAASRCFIYLKKARALEDIFVD